MVYYDKRNQFKIILASNIMTNNQLAFPIENVKPRVKLKVKLILCYINCPTSLVQGTQEYTCISDFHLVQGSGGLLKT